MEAEMVIVNGPQGANGDENLAVKFFDRQVPNNFKSKSEGRPVFDSQCTVSIITPGQNSVRVDRKATDSDKARFPKQYDRYLRNQNDVVTGMPIEQCPFVLREQVDELKALRFDTAELLAAASDAQLLHLPGGMTLRRQAQHYLKTVADSAVAMKAQAANDELKAQNAALQDQLNKLAAQVEAMAKAPVAVPKKRGRKSNAQKAAEAAAAQA